MTDRIGFIGLGLMGRHMARNLLAAGLPLTVHSRSPGPVEELAGFGAATAASPAAVAAASDVIVTMLPDTPDVESVLFGGRGVVEEAAAGALVIDMSTIDPIASRDMASRLAARGVDMVDAPVSGGDIGARDGTLSIMVGGDDGPVARAMPLFEVMGRTIVHVGGPGAGQVTKACNQIVVGGTLAAVAEALVFARRAGVDPARVRESLLGGFAASRILEVHGRRMLEGDYVPGFFARLMLKDARIVVAAARELGVSVPVFEVVERELERLVADEGGEIDYSGFVRLREADAGVTVAETP